MVVDYSFVEMAVDSKMFDLAIAMQVVGVHKQVGHKRLRYMRQDLDGFVIVTDVGSMVVVGNRNTLVVQMIFHTLYCLLAPEEIHHVTDSALRQESTELPAKESLWTFLQETTKQTVSWALNTKVNSRNKIIRCGVFLCFHSCW